MYCTFYIMSEMHLGDFTYNVDQWIILRYAIVYDETIGCCICGHIFLAMKFYAYVHNGTLDGFILSRESMTTKVLFSINENTLSSVSKQSIS